MLLAAFFKDEAPSSMKWIKFSEATLEPQAAVRDILLAWWMSCA